MERIFNFQLYSSCLNSFWTRRKTYFVACTLSIRLVLKKFEVSHTILLSQELFNSSRLVQPLIVWSVLIDFHNSIRFGFVHMQCMCNSLNIGCLIRDMYSFKCDNNIHPWRVCACGFNSCEHCADVNFIGRYVCIMYTLHSVHCVHTHHTHSLSDTSNLMFNYIYIKVLTNLSFVPLERFWPQRMYQSVFKWLLVDMHRVLGCRCVCVCVCVSRMCQANLNSSKPFRSSK